MHSGSSCNNEFRGGRITFHQLFSGFAYMYLSTARPADTRSFAARIGRLALSLTAALYLIQMLTPLRLSTDSVLYLSMTASAADGQGFLYLGHKAQFPVGYPLILLAAEKAGIGNSQGFVLINCLFAALGVWSAYGLYRRAFRLERTECLLLTILLLLSYLLVRHVTMILTEVPFFGCTLFCLWLLHLSEESHGRTRWLLLVAAAVVAIGASAVRTAGVALFAAVAWNCWLTVSGPLGGQGKHGVWTTRRLLLISVGALLVLAGGWGLTQTEYFKGIVQEYSLLGPWGAVRNFVAGNLSAIGHVAANLPDSALSGTRAAIIYPLVGLVAVVFIGRGLWSRRCSLKSIDLFFLAYVALLLSVPWTRSRYWLGVLPLMIVYAMLGGKELLPARVAAWTGRLWLSTWLVFGLLALAQTTRLTFSGTEFGSKYGGGSVRAEYEAAFTGRVLPAASYSPFSQAMVGVLRRYERLAKPEAQTR